MPNLVAVRAETFQEIGQWIASHSDDDANRFVAAARLYQQGLRLLFDNPSLTYLVLVSVVETIAGRRDTTIDVNDLVKRRGDWVSALKRAGYVEDEANRIVGVLAGPATRVRDKFVDFLKRYTPDAVKAGPAALFPGYGEFASLWPKADQFEEALDAIYDQRSALSHGGRDYSPYIAVGTSPWVPYDAMRTLSRDRAGERVIPAVTWFEAVVHAAVLNFTGIEMGAAPSQ